MTSEVAICNLAVTHLGQKPQITSISPPDGYIHSARCALFYPIARNVTLESRDWSFASKRVALSTATVTVESGQFPYTFAMPSDCLRPISVLPEGATDEDQDVVDFMVEGDTLYTTIEEPILRYTRLITDVTKFSPLCQSAISWLLASYVAGAITEDKAVKTWCIDMYELELSKAGASNGARKQVTQNFTAGGIAAR